VSDPESLTHERVLMGQLDSAEWQAWLKWGHEQLERRRDRLARTFLHDDQRHDYEMLQRERGWIMGFRAALAGPRLARQEWERLTESTKEG
jgi:hypothetical protein